LLKFSGILRGNKIESGVLLLVIDNSTLALDSETPLPIRKRILPHTLTLSLCVSYSRENKGDTLCLPQRTPIRIGCCNKAAPHTNLVFYYVWLISLSSFSAGKGIEPCYHLKNMNALYNSFAEYCID
jgi:hypothetical protein